jgi:hypothetical protein
MHTEQSPKKKHAPNFRRPFACGGIVNDDIQTISYLVDYQVVSYSCQFSSLSVSVFNVQENLVHDDDHFGEDRPFSVPLFP